jgi:NarL family two-component system response regulator YdfI
MSHPQAARQQADTQRIRVVVVDDHPVVREGLRLILEIAGPDLEVVGEAADGAAAIQLVEETAPDVMLLDLRMPGMDGLEALAQIHERWPHLAIIILTTYDDDALLLRGLRAGARGYLLKEVDRETLLRVIRGAARGEALLQPEMLARVISLAHPPMETTASDGHTGEVEPVLLTERERFILARVARGDRSKEIAARLGITTSTVAAHLTNIYTKLGADSRAAAVARALQRGLIPPEPPEEEEEEE